METIKELLNQRQITDGTKNLYLKKLEMLHTALSEGEDNYDFLKDTDKTLEWIAQFNSAKRRSLLNSAMVGISPASRTDIPEDVADIYKIYQDKMLGETTKYEEGKSEQTKSDREGANWATIKDLQKVLKTYSAVLRVKGINNKNPPTRKDDIQTLQKILVGSLYLMHPPRRLEYGEMMRINEKDFNALDTDVKERNNFIVSKSKFKMYFSFGNTKVKTTTSLKIDLHKDLVKIVRLWYSATPTAQSFLLTRNGEPQNCNGLSHFLISQVFEPTGKKIGAGMIRKIYLSEKYKDDTPLKEKQELGKLMNHASTTADLHYIKKD